MIARAWERVANEPALATAVVLAVANMLGVDGTDAANLVESLVVFLAGVFVRAKVTPVRKLG
ncbi:MAG UNVERIFIED_CONTAM: hypothetical protein LOD86_14595 [Thermobifida fusca]